MRLTIVLVDDSDALLAAVADTLCTRAQYHVEVATNAFDGLEQCRRWHPDCAVIDLLLKDQQVDGIQLIHQLRHDPQTADIPLVILSQSSRQTQLVGLAMGADQIVSKPTNYFELVAAIELAVKRSRGDDR